MGDVHIRVHSDSVWKLQKVRHVPDLKKNLISMGQLDDERHSINFHGGKWKVRIGARILAQRYKTCTLYMTTNIRDTTAVVDASVNSKLWHLRLGHMSKKGMKVLLFKGKLLELKLFESDICEGCILGKQKKVSFAKIGKAPCSRLTGYVDFKFISLPLAIVRIDCTIVRVIEPQRLFVVLRNGILKSVSNLT
jgi:hypothetical protein